MKDSEIPAFTTKVLAVCKQAVRDGWYREPKPPGEYNGHWCPLQAYAQVGCGLSMSEQVIANSFMRGYDLKGYGGVRDYRFYVLGQAFRKIADTIGFL